MITVFLVLAAFGAGCAIGEWDTLKRWVAGDRSNRIGTPTMTGE